MILPFKGLYIFTQDFGANPQNYSQYGLKGHDGLDFGCPTRTEIVAPHSGTIIEASFDANGYGNYIKIENEQEGSVIAHLESIDVQVGYRLNEGDHIGWSDNTGNSTGPHCHWGYYLFPRDRQNGFAGFINQAPLLEQYGVHLILGQLPVIDNSNLQNASINGLNTYGLDITSHDTLQSVLDSWHSLAIGEHVTKVDYNNLQTQYDAVKGQLENLQKESATLSPDINNYHAMQALGYNTVDDITKSLQEKDTLILKLQQEQVLLEKKNEQLAATIAEDSKNNYTGMEEGIKAVDRVRELEDYVIQIQRAAGINLPEPRNVISKIIQLKDRADKFMQKLEDENKLKQLQHQAVTSMKQVQQNGVEWLLSAFRLQSDKEVK